MKRSLRERGLLAAPVPTRREAVWRSLSWAAAAALFFAAGALVGQRGPGAPPAGVGQLFALFLYEDSTFQVDVPEASLVAEYSAWADSLRGRGALVAGEKLRAGAGITLVGDTRRASPDGLGGFFIVRAAGEAEALALAASCPHLKYGGRIVLRAIEPT